jgi:hypothetical protein
VTAYRRDGDDERRTENGIQESGDATPNPPIRRYADKGLGPIRTISACHTNQSIVAATHTR